MCVIKNNPQISQIEQIGKHLYREGRQVYKGFLRAPSGLRGLISLFDDSKKSKRKIRVICG